MLSGIIIILNLVLLEIVLSIDNAAVLSTMVNDLPKKQHKNNDVFFKKNTAFFTK